MINREKEVVIEFRNVYKRFGEKVIFNNISFKVYKGETVVFFGPSACGKTTLLKMIEGLVKPDKGQIFFKGVDITKLSDKELNSIRTKIGMLFQYYALFDSMTVEENIGFYLRENTKLPVNQIKDKVNEYLKLVGLEGINNLKPSQLSGGMKRRVGLVRAIIYQPEVILYDSPTDGLDPVNADIINDLIIQMNKRFNITSIVISNDMGTVYKLGHRVGLIYDGEIIALDDKDKIFNSKNEYVYQFIHGLDEGPIKLF